MITDEVTYTIQCTTQAEYDAEKARLLALPNLKPSPQFTDALLLIKLYQKTTR